MLSVLIPQHTFLVIVISLIKSLDLHVITSTGGKKAKNKIEIVHGLLAICHRYSIQVVCGLISGFDCYHIDCS